MVLPREGGNKQLSKDAAGTQQISYRIKHPHRGGSSCIRRISPDISNEKLEISAIRTSHEIREIHPVAPILRIAICHDPVVDKFPPESIGNDHDGALDLGTGGGLSNIRFEAMESDNFAFRRSVVDMPGEAIWTGHDCSQLDKSFIKFRY